LYSSRLTHSLRGRKPNKHLVLGSAVHHALGAYYGSGPTQQEWDAPGALVAYDAYIQREREAGLEVDDELENFIALGREMVRNYIPFSKMNDDFTVIQPEVSLEYDFNDFYFAGTTDGVVKDNQNGIWLLEHKTAAQFPNTAALSFSMQAAMYCWVAQKTPAISSLGSVRGVMFNILRKAVPTQPKMLKSGRGMERRKDIGCTPQQYLEAVARAGFDPNEYAEFAAELDPNKFVHREYISLPLSSLGVAVTEFTYIAHDMMAILEAVDSGAPTPPTAYRCDPLRMCSWCDYRSLCSQKLFGRSWKEIAAFDFVREDKFDGESED